MIVRTPQVITYGMASRCNDGRHVTFLDYDGVTEDVVIEEIQALQEMYKLGTFALFQTDEKGLSWHAVCLDKRPLIDVIDTIYNSSCDIAFKKAPLFYQYRSWVLRIAPKGKKAKPKFVRFIESPYAEYEQSSAHAKLLKLWYNIDFPLKRPDCEISAPNLPPIRLVSYKTAKRVK